MNSPWERERRRAAWDGNSIHGATSRAECAVCGAEGEAAGLIGLCYVCEAGPICDACAAKHEAATGGRHPSLVGSDTPAPGSSANATTDERKGE